MSDPTPSYLASVAARAEREQLLADAGVFTHDDKSQTWTTLHGDTVTVWQSAPLGHLLDWRWHVRAAGNHEVVGQGEGHTRRSAARQAAMRHHPVVTDAAVDAGARWLWAFMGGHGELSDQSDEQRARIRGNALGFVVAVRGAAL